MSAFPSSMHVHTHYGDGKNSPEEMIREAIALGFTSIGISEHAWAQHDLDVCIPKSKMESYRTEVMHLKEKYADKIEVGCGLEVDYYGNWDRSGWDYIIGSVHFVRNEETGSYYTVDFNAEILAQGIWDIGGGSVQRFIERYAENVLQVVKLRPDIIGHIDVIAKLNQKSRFFDPGAHWYKDIWEKVIPAIAKSGCVTEVNTGGMSGGYTEHPYPSPDLLRMLYREGAALTLCSDAHKKETLEYGFDECLDLLREVGYNSIKLWRGGKFVDFGI